MNAPRRESRRRRVPGLALALLGVVLLLGAAWAYRAIAAGELLTWWTADGGGGESSGGRWAVRGTAGQTDAGSALAGGRFEVVGGFWGGRGLESETLVNLPLILRGR